MFWKRNKDQNKDVDGAAPTPAVSSAGSEEERAIDTIGALLRTFGRFSFDLDEGDQKTFADECEAWAQHILVKRARPGKSALDLSGRRDYSATTLFFTQRRRSESEYVRKSMDDLRQIVWAFVHSLSRAVPEENAADSRAIEQLEKLRLAVMSDSVEDIKREAMSAVKTIDDLVDKRQNQNSKRREQLGAKLKQFSHRLQPSAEPAEGAVDALTQLTNRASFEEELERICDISTFFRQPTTLLVVDIDRMKAINDKWGRAVGDRVLKLVADSLVRAFPRKGDCVARIGDDEFAVLLRHAERGDVRQSADTRVLKAVRAHQIQAGQETFTFTVSIGLSAIGIAEPATLWLDRTQRALRSARTGGGDRIVESEG